MATSTSTHKRTTKATTTAPAPKRTGMGNTPPPAGPVVPSNLAGVVAPATPAPAPAAPAPLGTPATRTTAAQLAATMAANVAANTAAKAASKAAPAKAAPAAKAATAKASATPAPAATTATPPTTPAQAAKAATAATVLAWLQAHAGTAYSVNQVEVGTGLGPMWPNTVKTLRPTLHALANAGTIQGPNQGVRSADNRKGFMVPAVVTPAPAPKAAPKAAAPRKAAAPKASASK